MGAARDLWNQYEALSNKHDWAGVASLFGSNGFHSDPTGRREGPEAIEASLEAGGHTFPDQAGRTSLLIEDGEIVVAEWTFRGTHTGPLHLPGGAEIPPTGKAIEFPGVTVAEVMNGKFRSMREYFDLMSAMGQLGLMPGA
jgi:steroid delta-isomerase-like uncharacterized protein